MTDLMQYAKRDAAWVAWLKQTGKFDQGYDIGQRAAAKFAFDAGWEARKRAELEALMSRNADTLSAWIARRPR
jgi:hypothetical protein